MFNTTSRHSNYAFM